MATVGAPGTPGMTPTILRQIMTTDALHRIRGLGQAIDVDRQAPHLMAQQLEALNDTLTSIDHAWYGDRCGAQENRIKVNQAMILNTVVYQQLDRHIRGAARRANAYMFNRVMYGPHGPGGAVDNGGNVQTPKPVAARQRLHPGKGTEFYSHDGADRHSPQDLFHWVQEQQQVFDAAKEGAVEKLTHGDTIQHCKSLIKGNALSDLNAAIEEAMQIPTNTHVLE